MRDDVVINSVKIFNFQKIKNFTTETGAAAATKTNKENAATAATKRSPAAAVKKEVAIAIEKEKVIPTIEETAPAAMAVRNPIEENCEKYSKKQCRNSNLKKSEEFENDRINGLIKENEMCKAFIAFIINQQNKQLITYGIKVLKQFIASNSTIAD